MRICVNCGLSFDEGRYCTRCGYILRSRSVSSQPTTVIESRVSQPVEFVSNSDSRFVSRLRRGSRVSSSKVLGFFFIFLALLLFTIFFSPSFFGSFVGLFGELGSEFGELGGEFGELGGEFGELGGEFGELGGEFGGRMGNCPFDGSSFLLLFPIVFVLACFLILGVILLLRSKQRNNSTSVRWD